MKLCTLIAGNHSHGSSERPATLFGRLDFQGIYIYNPSAPNTLVRRCIGTQNPLQNHLQKGAVSIRVYNIWLFQGIYIVKRIIRKVSKTPSNSWMVCRIPGHDWTLSYLEDGLPLRILGVWKGVNLPPSIARSTGSLEDENDHFLYRLMVWSSCRGFSNLNRMPGAKLLHLGVGFIEIYQPFWCFRG